MAFSTTSLPGHVDVKLSSTVKTPTFLNGSKEESKRTLQPITTGTSVLGVKFDGGVALAGDMLGSYGSLARYPNVSRLIQVDDKTVVFASGDYADYQYLKEEMERLSIENDIEDDGHSMSSKSIFSYLRLLMYYRRNKFNPIWNTLAVGGYNDGKPFLGYVDKIGSAYEENSLATGYGAYIARPLIEKAIEEKGRQLTKVEAVKLLIECLKILYYRDARSINKFEIAVITEDGVTVESNMTADTNWDIAHYVKGYE